MDSKLFFTMMLGMAMNGYAEMPQKRELRRFRLIREGEPKPRTEEEKRRKKQARKKTMKRRKRRGW